MEQVEYPSAEVRYNENLLAIEYFKTYPKEAKRGNPYNTTFCIRVISGAFCGYASCEYDIREFVKFVSEIEEVYQFKESKAELNDICYGSKVSFCMDKKEHLEISGELFGQAAEQRLVFCFKADQTCLKDFIQTLKTYIE